MKGYLPVDLLKRSLCSVMLIVGSAPVIAELSIEKAQTLAVASDAGISQVLLQSDAMRYNAEASAQLPDPTLILGAQNFPTDSFELDQEPMTQLKVGVRQMFPQGDTLSLQSFKFNTMAANLDAKAQTRYLNVTRMVRKRWLEILYWARAEEIIQQDKSLFLQLIEVTRSLYSVGNVQQQDVLRAELELSRLEEKLIKARRQGEIERAKLSRWIGLVATTESWPESLPVMLLPDNFQEQMAHSQTSWATQLAEHPELISAQRDIDLADNDIRLSKQKYQPAWGVELSYGYRDGKNMDGSQRSDFVSAMVNVSLPLFTAQRQDKSVQSATYRKEALKNGYQDKLNEMLGDIQALNRQLLQTEEQLTLFDEHILTKARLQAESSLSAYQADATNFSDVMRAYLSEQKDRLDYERLVINRLQLISELTFYFDSTIPDISALVANTATGEIQP